MSNSWKFGLAGAVALGVIAVGTVTVSQPASARPTVTVYKTPT